MATDTVSKPADMNLVEQYRKQFASQAGGSVLNESVNNVTSNPFDATNIKKSGVTYSPPPTPSVTNTQIGVETTATKIDNTPTTSTTAKNEGFSRDDILGYLKQTLGDQANLANEKQDLRDAAQVAEKERRARELGNEITATKQAYQKQLDEMEKNAEGKFGGALKSEMDDLRRKANRELADLAIQYEVFNGDYQAAEKLVNQQIEDIESDYNRRIQTLQVAYDFLQNDMSESEKTLAAQQFQILQDEKNFEQQKALADYNAVIDRENMAYNASLDRQNAAYKASLENETPDKTTDAQNKAATFAQRIEDANAVIAETEDAGTSLEAYFSAAIPNMAKSGELQKYEQAQRNFINAVLRRESGAVISNEEFDNARKQYFPQPGDSQETLEQKTRNRKVAQLGLSTEAGSALTNLKTNLSTQGQSTQVTSTGTTKSGVKYQILAPLSQ